MPDGPNLFDVTKSTINALKKPKIVKRIIELKCKVVVDEEIKSLRTHIKELTDTVNQLLSKNERLSGDLAIQKTVFGNLEKKFKSLESRYRRTSSTIAIIALNFPALLTLWR